MTWPPESQPTVFNGRPLWAVKIVVTCQPPTTWLTTPPRLRNALPCPKGSSYSTEATRRSGVLKADGPYSHFRLQYGFSGYVSVAVPRIALPLSSAFDHVNATRVVKPDLYRWL